MAAHRAFDRPYYGGDDRILIEMIDSPNRTVLQFRLLIILALLYHIMLLPS